MQQRPRRTSYAPFVAEILKPEFRACDHHHQVRTAVRGEEGNLILNVSRCGPEITEILLNDALRRCRNNTDPNHRHGPSDDRVIPRSDKNMVIPQSIFFEANKIFSDTFDGRGPHTFIEQANGLCQHLLLQTSLEKGNGWCKCQLNNDASPPGKCCFLHYIFAGKAAAPTVINLSRLWLTVAEATKRTGKRPSQLDELKITPTPGTHNKCFFSAISIAMFGSPCYASILKQRCILWVRSLPLSDPVLGPWTEANQDPETANKAINFHLAKFAGGMVETLDFPITLVWALAELWVDVLVISDEVNLDDPSRTAIAVTGLNLVKLLNAGHHLKRIMDNVGIDFGTNDIKPPTVPTCISRPPNGPTSGVGASAP